MLPRKEKICKSIKTMLLATSLGILPAYTPAVSAAELIQAPVVSDYMVRLSDLFTDVGDKADTIVMQSPAPGSRDTITAYELTALAKEYEIDWERPSYVKRIYLTREGEAFSLQDLKPQLLDQINDLGTSPDIDLTLYGRKNGLFLPTGYGIDDITFKDLSLNQPKNRFSVTLEIPSGGPLPQEINVSGSITEVRLVPVLNRMVTPGEIITKADISWEKYPVRRINRSIETSGQALIGQTVRRAVSANQLIRSTDVIMPVLIEKGSRVTMTFTKGALQLSAQGRALDDGGRGDIIRVMNDKSNLTLEAKVLGPDNVVVMASNVQQLAAR